MSTHLVKHQKITKRQMKEDQLVTAAFRATDLWERHGNRILIVLGAVALLGLLAFFMSQARAKAEEKASGDLFRATLAVNQNDYDAAVGMLKEIIDSQPGTDAAREAMLYLGDAYLGQRKPTDAAASYRKYLGKAGGDRERARTGYYALGTALEDAGQFGPAADAYADAAKRSSSDNERGRAMLAQARSLLRSGQTAKAAEIYKAVVALPSAEQAIMDAANVHLGEIAATQQTP